jgi:hypothetical protein
LLAGTPAAITSVPSETKSLPPARAACSAAEHHELDFWIGEWTVYNTADNVEYGSSRIVPVMDGCGSQENYASPAAPGGAYFGTSYSGFDRRDKRWHQMYIDVNGNVTWYSGALNGKNMELTAPGKPGSVQKMVYKPLPDGSVEQVGTLSTDGGKSWQLSYDYTYRPTKKAVGKD